LVLIDESAGRSAAKKEGLVVIGVLGVLLEAKHQGLIGAVGPLLDQLQIRYHFFIGEQLRRQVLQAAGE
jgi:predicted nucleic acid-binding protein